MLNPDTMMLARVLHEERVAEALQKQRHWPLRDPGVGLLTRLLLNLGNRLVNLGQKLKALATQPAQELAEA